MKKRPYRKSIVLLFTVAVFCIGYASVSFGAPSHGVKYTKHNLGTTNTLGGFKSTNETEICIFCHTPHNAVAGKQFLWNRNGVIPDFNLYTSSPTLSFTSKPATASAVSKMCLTCHDGATSLNSMANPRPVVMTGYDQLGDVYWGQEPSPPFLGWGANIGNAVLPDQGIPANYNYQAPTSGGNNLTNDHPISFIYSQSSANDSGIKTADGPGGSSIGGLPLWWGAIGAQSGYMLECVTCHDPHINYVAQPAYKPFLRKTVYSSSLCFTCHNK